MLSVWMNITMEYLTDRETIQRIHVYTKNEGSYKSQKRHKKGYLARSAFYVGLVHLSQLIVILS